MPPAPAPVFTIAPAAGPEAIAAAAGLFRDYAASLGIDLGYQGFDAELAGLPGDYAPPAGALLLARDAAGRALGCVALRALAGVDGTAEMKRLYVAPAARGLGLGRALLDAVLAAARDSGYLEVRLDTLPTLARAIDLYVRSGFVEIDAYYSTPVAGTRFFMRRVAPAG